MSLYPTLFTPVLLSNGDARWELVAMGVKFIFVGSYGLQRQEVKISNEHDGINNLHVAGSRLDKRNGRYR